MALFPQKDELVEWHKHSFSPVGLSISEIQKYKKSGFKLHNIRTCKNIYEKKGSSNLFLLIKEIQINEDSKGFLVFDTDQKNKSL